MAVRRAVVLTVAIINGAVACAPDPAAPGPPSTAVATPAATQTSAVTPASTSASVIVSDVSIEGGRVAYLVLPASTSAHTAPGIVWFHWYETTSPKSNRTEFLDEAKALAADGVASVLVDGTFPWHEAPESTEHDLAAVVAEVAMVGKARDLLEAQPVVDPGRVALVGHDFGAMYSAVLFGQDQSIVGLVAMTPTGRWAEWFLRYWPIKDDPISYKNAMSPLDPVTALGHANGRPALFQFGNQDRFVPAPTTAEIVNAAGSGAQRMDYDAGHELDDAARADRDAWLASVLNLRD